MATTSQKNVVNVGGIPTVTDVDSSLWGTGTVAARPGTGDAVGDIYIVQDPPLYAFDIWDGSAWVRITVKGPSGGSVDNRIVRWDGTGGAQTQNSLVAVSDAGHLDPAAAGQDIGPTTAWRRLFANHMVHGVDVFAAVNTLDDARYVVAQNGTYTLTLPTAAAGWGYIIERQGSTGTVTIAAGGGDTINGSATYVMLPDSVNYIFAENATDWRLFHLMTVADKTKLDGLSAAGSVEHATMFSGLTAGTVSPTFVDAFAGSSVKPPSDGDYRVVFSGEYTASNGNTGVEVAVGKNSTTVAQTDSERLVTPPSANKTNTFFTSAILTGLLQADDINGIFRRPTGSGSAQIKRRRFTILKVTS